MTDKKYEEIAGSGRLRVTTRADVSRALARREERTSLPVNFQDWVNTMLSYQGVNYGLSGYSQTLKGEDQEFGADYGGLGAGGLRGNAIIFACMNVRAMYFSEARFQWQDLGAGRPGKLFGTQELQLLETPWPNGTTGNLLSRMSQSVDLAGNAYVVRERDRLAVLRPDWVNIMLGSRTGRESWVAGDGDTEVAGYVYWPGGPHSGSDPLTYSPSEIAHFAPYPDPEAVYRGMSWITPLVREVQADSAMTSFKQSFLRNGATVNLVVKFNTPKQDEFDKAVARFKETHEGVANAYRTLFLSTGTDVTPVGANLQQMDFSNTQASGELRIASAAQVPPVILGLREGLQGSTLNSGNFSSSRRMFSDGCILPLWRFACAALQTILTGPGSARLWYDVRDVPFLKEDLKDVAEVQAKQASAALSWVNAGYQPQSVIDALAADDLTLLKPISGLTTVQLTPLTGSSGGTQSGASNGAGNGNTPMVPAQSG